MGEKNYEPLYFLPDEYLRVMGRKAQRNNIAAAKLVAEAVRTTLGPKGMDKMIVDSSNNVIVTNDGAEILSHLSLEHPVARMIADISKNQERSVGDGTTTAAVLAGELLSHAERLLDMNIHPSVIIKGYRMALRKAKDILKTLSTETEPDDDMLKRIAETAMTGKGAEQAKDILADICVKAVKAISREKKIDPSDVMIRSIKGGSVEDSELVQGIVLEKEKVNTSMPQELKKAKVLLLDAPLEVRETEISANIQINNPEQMHKFIDMEDSMIREMIDKIEEMDVDVVFCQKGIDNLAAHYLAKKGIFALRRVKRSEMQKLAKMSKGRIISTLEEASSDDLGHIDELREDRLSEESYVFVESKTSNVVSLIARGSTVEAMDEVKRALDDAVGDLTTFMRGRRIVAGAGACEVALLTQIARYSEELTGKEQLAVRAFSEALEIIPKTLAENAGLDPIDILASLKVEHNEGHEHKGIDVFDGSIIDAFDKGIVEPFQVKLEAVVSATELAIMILRIDDVITAQPTKAQEKQEEK